MNMLPYSGFPALPKNIEDMHNQLVTLGLNDVEALTARIKKCEDWVDNVEETELTGNPVIFQNALAVPAKSLAATLEPIQDLHGYDKPWAGGAGKNKLPVTLASLKSLNTSGTWTDNVYVYRGVTYTVYEDNGGNVSRITSNGTATGGNANFTLASNLSVTDSFLSGCPSGGSATTFFIRGAIGTDYPTDTGSGVAVSGTLSSVWIGVLENETAPSGNWLPMIESGSAKTSYEPYSNICPISGRTEARVDTENEDSSDSAYATIQLGTTVYGGTVDFVTGVAIVDIKYATLDGTQTMNQTGDGKCFYCDDFPDGKYIEGTLGQNRAKMSFLKNGLNASDVRNLVIKDAFVYASQTSSAEPRLLFNSTVFSTITELNTWLANNPQDFAYELATPTTLQLTPSQLQMLKGYNRVSSDDASSITIEAYTGGPWEAVTRAIKKVTNKTKTTKKRRK